MHGTGGDLSIVHLVPLAISSSYATKVMSLVTALPGVDQHGIEHIIQVSYFLLRTSSRKEGGGEGRKKKKSKGRKRGRRQ